MRRGAFADLWGGKIGVSFELALTAHCASSLLAHSAERSGYSSRLRIIILKRACLMHIAVLAVGLTQTCCRARPFQILAVELGVGDRNRHGDCHPTHGSDVLLLSERGEMLSRFGAGSRRLVRTCPFRLCAANNF
eukprot:1490274-Pleurochrysis_carterae.AAC.1